MTNKDTAVLLDSSIWTGRFFAIGWQSGKSTVPVIEPSTGKELGIVALADAEQLARSADSASKAQGAWFAKPHDARSALFRRAAQIAEQHAAEMVDWLVREAGSTRAKAQFETAISIKVLHECAGMPSRNIGEVMPSQAGRLSLARRRPLGVIGVISPFNFPLYLALRAIAPALAVGNAVVHKPDPRTAISGGFAIVRIFELAGLPDGLLHVLPGGGDVGAALVADPKVAMIQFTGSTAAGRKVGEAAGRHLKKVSLELGGKNSLIILDDADMDLAIANAAWGVYLHQGQICMATGRVLVQRGLHDAFVKRLVEKARGLPVGNPAVEDVAIGPLINASQRDHVDRVVKAAQADGAKLETGGTFEGLVYHPTVLSGVTRSNPAFKEEIFGPVAVVVPFDTDDDAVRLANDTEYGLSAGIISGSVGRALKLGEQLRTGLLHINDQTVNDDVINPFGGVGASGNGTSIGGSANWEEFTQWQWLTVKSEATLYPM